MSSLATPALSPADPAAWAELSREWQSLGQAWLQWWQPRGFAPATPAFTPSLHPAPVDPGRLADLNARYQAHVQALWHATQQAFAATGVALAEVVSTPAGDRRFVSPAWHAQPYFSFLRQAYLLYAEYLLELVELMQLPADEKKRLQFATRQYIDAIAPTNFAATNPEVLKRALETDGASLVDGLRNLIEDAQKGRISMTDESAFAIGRNLAVTPGSVVFRNDLIELIQYDATTPTVHARPLLIVPPCINKYYILDLRPENSFVRHTVERGHTTFIISWRNVPEELGHLTWDDYLEQGVLTAMRVVTEIARSTSLDVLGFCVGGTLLACALAVLAARGDHRAASVTLLTTMLDYRDPGEIGVYITPEGVAAREPALCAGQRVHGSELAGAFASLRANELVWNYVVNNYLKGRTPPAFDLLYWNGDASNLPGPMYAFYLKEFYVRNRLREPGALTMLGEAIDLRLLTMPAYIYASREDHIVPWRSAFRSCALVGGESVFVLGASGHIAGVVNPPEAKRRNFWQNAVRSDDPDDWLAQAQSVAGSWWIHWDAWIASRAGARKRAPASTGNKKFPPIEPAPGSYVLAPT